MSRHYLRATILTASLGFAATLPVHAAAAAAAPAAIAAPASGPIRPTINLSLNEAINIAIQKGFDVKLQNLTLETGKEGYNSSKLEYKPTMSVGAGISGSQSGATGTATAAGDHTDSSNVTASVSQKIPTGAVVSLTSTILSRANTAGSPTTPNYGRNLILGITQPLLRGFGTTYNLTALRNAKISLDQSYLTYRTSMISLVNRIESAYISLVTARQNLEVQRQSLALAEQTFNEQKSRSQAGLVTPINLFGSETNFLSSQNSLLDRERLLRSAEDQLRLLLGGGEYDVGIIPTDDLASEQMEIPTIAGSYRLALDNGADYKNQKYAVQTAETAVYIAKQNLKPSLGLSGSITTSDTGVSSWPSTYHRVSENSNYGWNVGLTLSVPLGERSDTITYRQRLIALERARVQLAQFEQSTLVSVRAAVDSVATSLRSLAISTRNADLAAQTYEADKQRFEVGAITIRTLNQSQADLDTNRFALITARLSLRTAINSLRVIENTTLDRYNIKLPQQDQ